ncbi:hypothetical protein BOTBODRAFT_27637 [Botryobasidium botryosum FD-172 SS1]|uniref:Uncharacterized protein n=1 Tax=Botryobasidium botryosum (strain FD-172 SS1) TaxID=930990 RepID=A0A067MWU4_BOTB1|nr:hypothetical protein BOTBODRAFT_27637 [Botryobasidium botryosum FD-172 SS1]
MFVDTPDTEKTHLGLGPPGSNNPRYGVWRRKSSREAYASADSLPGESSMVERYFD